MRVLAIDHVGGIATFRPRYDHLARRPGLDLTLLVPETWIENGRLVRGDAPAAAGYRVMTGRVAWRGYENRGFFVTGLTDALRSTRPDVLHLMEEPFSFFTAQTLALVRALRLEPEIFFYSFANVFRGFRYRYRPGWVYGAIERSCYRAVQAGVAACSDTRELLLSRGFEGPIRFIPPGVDEERFHPVRPGDPARPGEWRGFTVGYVGRLLHWKGLPVLAAAMERLDGDWTLVVIGSGPEEETLRRMAAAGGWSDRLIHRSAISHGDVPAVMRRLDALVLPSISTPLDAEQFGRVLIEAMASGVPVVGSTTGSIPEVIGPAGLIAAEKHPEALAVALTRLRDDDTLRRRLIAAGLDRIHRHFTWSRVAGQFGALYDALAAGRVEPESRPAWAGRAG